MEHRGIKREKRIVDLEDEEGAKERARKRKDAATPMDVFFRLDRKTIDALQKWNTIELECARCNQTYYECNNIGRWKCSQHAREWNASRGGDFYEVGRWDCCGSNYRKPLKGDAKWGCVRSDHTPIDAPYLVADDILLPKDLIRFVKPGPFSVVDLEKADLYDTLIKRPDKLHMEVEDDRGVVVGYSEEDYVVIRRYDWKEEAERKLRGESQIRCVFVGGCKIEEKYLSPYGVNT